MYLLGGKKTSPGPRPGSHASINCRHPRVV